MRYLVVGLTALASTMALAVPAQARSDDRAPEAEIARKMNDPAMQARVADAMSGMLGAVLDLRVGELERAIDPNAPVSKDETLRDRASRDDPYFEERMAHHARSMTGTMGTMATQFAHMMPELRKALGEMAGRVADIGGKVAVPDDRGWDD